MLAALAKGHEIVKDLCQAQLDFVAAFEAQFGAIKKIEATLNLPDESLYEKVSDYLTEEKLQSLYGQSKKGFQKVLDDLDIEVKKYLIENKIYEVEEHLHQDILESSDLDFVGNLVYKRVKVIMRKNILASGKRLDFRKPNEVRVIKGETGLLPRTHGSALFQRGMTQVLNVCTLGGPEDKQIVDGLFSETEKRYIHHYNFPPYSVGEVRMMR
jgi:polyribonucleotide nucleotidyltransferase